MTESGQSPPLLREQIQADCAHHTNETTEAMIQNMIQLSHNTTLAFVMNITSQLKNNTDDLVGV